MEEVLSSKRVMAQTIIESPRQQLAADQWPQALSLLERVRLFSMLAGVTAGVALLLALVALALAT
jgi:hypothetical protein